MNVVAVMPVKGRLPLLRVTIDRLLTRNGLREVICVGDTIEEYHAVKESGGIFVFYRNFPLAEKCNVGFQFARQYKPDAILFTGSSDWLSDNWVPTLAQHMNEYEMAGKMDYYMLDIGEYYRACHWLGYPKGEREDEPIGIGRMISSRFLDKINWRPLDARKNRSLDGILFKILKENNGKTKIIADDTLISLSISTNRWENMHNFELHWENKEIGQTNRISIDIINTHFPEYTKIFT